MHFYSQFAGNIYHFASQKFTHGEYSLLKNIVH